MLINCFYKGFSTDTFYTHNDTV